MLPTEQSWGKCELFLHKDEDDCEDGESEASYIAVDKDVNITPHFPWDSWSVLC